jgi:hypothetical protein
MHASFRVTHKDLRRKLRFASPHLGYFSNSPSELGIVAIEAADCRHTNARSEAALPEQDQEKRGVNAHENRTKRLHSQLTAVGDLDVAIPPGTQQKMLLKPSC